MEKAFQALLQTFAIGVLASTKTSLSEKFARIRFKKLKIEKSLSSKPLRKTKKKTAPKEKKPTRKKKAILQ
ncbi:MAG: hypothetical protein M9962_09270 [Oligoflexia bacterium]|nr:hypothetical protein [Oligoflexia bacterium]